MIIVTVTARLNNVNDNSHTSSSLPPSPPLLRLNNLRLPKWIEETYLRIESGLSDGTLRSIVPMSRADKLVCQKFEAMNPNTPMIANALFDGFKLDMQFPSIKLNVELDGPTHQYPARKRFDAQRDEYLNIKQVS